MKLEKAQKNTNKNYLFLKVERLIHGIEHEVLTWRTWVRFEALSDLNALCGSEVHAREGKEFTNKMDLK